MHVCVAHSFVRTCLVFGEGAVHVVFPSMAEHGAGFLAEFQLLGGSHGNCALEQTEDGEEDEQDAPTRGPWWMGSQGWREGHGGGFCFMGQGGRGKSKEREGGRPVELLESVKRSGSGGEEDATVAVMRVSQLPGG